MAWNLPHDFVPVFVVFAVFGFLTVSAVTHYVYKAYCFGQLTRLKERLLEAGMSSGEIERVINAGTGHEAEPLKMQKKPA